MPQHKSCKKRMRTSEDERIRNRALRSQMVKTIKAFKSITTRAEAESQFKEVISIIDRAALKNVIHKNKAARDKSNLYSFVSRLSG